MNEQSKKLYENHTTTDCIRFVRLNLSICVHRVQF